MDQHPESASEPIRNRVDESGLIALDLDDLMPVAPVLEFDLADYLEMGWVLKEKAFRAAMRELDAPKWAGSTVALYCSSDAIVPDWAWMLATSRLTTLGAHALVNGVGPQRKSIQSSHAGIGCSEMDWKHGRPVLQLRCHSSRLGVDVGHVEVDDPGRTRARWFPRGRACADAYARH